MRSEDEAETHPKCSSPTLSEYGDIRKLSRWRPIDVGEPPKQSDPAESFWLFEGLDINSPHRGIRCSFAKRMAQQVTSIEIEAVEMNRRHNVQRDDRIYPKQFCGSPLPSLPWGKSFREYPIFQEGHPTYASDSRPSGPGPVRVQVRWNDFDGRLEKGHYMITYHDNRKGPDVYWNVSLATRVSRTEALKAGPKSFREFERLFHETFHHCREALERQKNRSPENFRLIHLQHPTRFPVLE